MSNETELEMAKALIDAINNILPKTTEKNNPIVKNALDIAAAHYDLKKGTNKKK